MAIYDEHNGFRVTLTARDVTVRGDRDRGMRAFAGAAQRAVPGEKLVRRTIDDARLSNDRAVVYIRHR